MVTVDGITIVPLVKHRRSLTRELQRQQIRRMSRRLVKSGEIPQTPCLLCGAEKNLTIHHLEPMRPGDFVFLCESCHKRAHTPLYRTIQVPIASGQFSIRREAIVRRTDMPALRPEMPPEASEPLSIRPEAAVQRKEVDRG